MVRFSRKLLNWAPWPYSMSIRPIDPICPQVVFIRCGWHGVLPECYIYTLGCVTYHGARSSYDFIIPCISENRLVSFLEHSRYHPAPGNQKIEIAIGVKNKTFKPFYFVVSKMRLDKRNPNVVWELKSDNICPHFLAKKWSKTGKITHFVSFWHFLAKMG